MITQLARKKNPAQWEDTFRSWASPPSNSEIEKCEHAANMVRKAIKGSEQLSLRSIHVFAQGSYANRTNVRADSDVDICVLCEDTMFYELNDGLTTEELRIDPAPYHYSQFCDDVYQALADSLGYGSLTRHNKHFDVHATSYRVDADVVACFDFRRYHRCSDGTIYHHLGTAFLPDIGNRVVNWPVQNYDNGVKKNKQTGNRFKKIVRILKRLRNEMAEAGNLSALDLSSFLIECLVWNVPNPRFNNEYYIDDARRCLAFLFNETMNDNDCSHWGEINELHYLFKGTGPGTREQAHSFASAAWDYIGFED